MKIDSYSFGSIVIGGKEYTSDVLIFGDELKPDWWRVQGHRLRIEDLSWILKRKPEVLVIGQGMSGMMAVPGEVKKELENRGIQVIIERTEKACKIFNELSQAKKAAALHLTC
jgi:hypothetical protein